MSRTLRIGTRDSELAVWQATLVQGLLKQNGIASELVYIKSEGDIDTITPLYALGVTGVFTKTLDTALLNKRIDLAVHSMKDVPVQLAGGIRQASVLKRGSHKDIFVPHPDLTDVKSILGEGLEQTVLYHVMESESHREVIEEILPSQDYIEPADAVIATSSIRRIAQWRMKYPNHKIENLRGNVNTRLRKLKESKWHGAIFAAAGLERIGLRPANAIDLDWMLPAPAQGAIMVVCREDDEFAVSCCQPFNHEETALCVKIERDFLSGLMGGCSTPISALAEVIDGEVSFKGNIVNPDKEYNDFHTAAKFKLADASDMGTKLARDILSNADGRSVIEHLRNKGLTDGEA